ncbi:uncharacterized protein LOC124462930 isoform X2 [Hypomesus transpacificus]|nr:uncharacterized protein LOC124462930 isoform X2 [Hypomesus transpacificus]
MGVTNQLFLIPVLLTLVRTQKLQVSMVPNLNQVYAGDTLKLTCNNKGSSVKWFFNNILSNNILSPEKELQMTAISAKNSGSYRCESNGQRSDNFNISVLAYLPPSILSIRSGLPVIQRGSSVTLNLEVEDGLQGWTCWVYKKGEVINMRMKKTLMTADQTEVAFQPYRLEENMGLYWCSDPTNQTRSSMVTLRTSERMVLMETPWSPRSEDNVALECIVPGAEIERTRFYKDEILIQDGDSTSFPIDRVTQADQGSYKCKATYKGVVTRQTVEHLSEVQELVVMDAPPRASLYMTTTMSMYCACSVCPHSTSYRWYYQEPDKTRLSRVHEVTGPSYSNEILPGRYACRVIWQDGRTSMSKIHEVSGELNWLMPLVVVAGLLLFIVVVFIAVFRCKKRNRPNADGIYEDVPMMGVKAGGEDGGYEELKRKRDQAEYDTLEAVAGDPESKRGAKEKVTSVTAAPSSEAGGYEQLRLKAVVDKDNEYHTLKADAQGVKKKDGEYEALKAEPEREGVYHTLKADAQGVKKKDGEYEALKAEPEREGVYHTLKADAQGVKKKDGEYEALKAEPEREGVYHTLKADAQGVKKKDGEYEALKAEPEREWVNHTLGLVQGAEGGAELGSQVAK